MLTAVDTPAPSAPPETEQEQLDWLRIVPFAALACLEGSHEIGGGAGHAAASRNSSTGCA